jgi:hypothetical protein
MINRRALVKLLALLPFVGPAIVKGFAKPGFIPRRVYGPYLPAFFPKWDKAVDGLESSGKWMWDSQRSFLPSNIVFPRVGQVWEAIRDCEIDTPRLPPFKSFSPGQWWFSPKAPPFFPASSEQIRQGERVRIVGVDDPKPVYVSFQLLCRDELPGAIGPGNGSQPPGRGDHVLSLRTAKTVADLAPQNSQTYFTEAFRLVKDTNA